MTKPSPQTIKALMDSVRLNSTSSLKEQIDALEQGVLDLEAQIAAKQAEVRAIDAQRDGWRAEAWAWRVKAAEPKTTVFLPPLEVQTKKFKRVRAPFEAVPDLPVPANIAPLLKGVLEWNSIMRAGEIAGLLAGRVGVDRGRRVQDYAYSLIFNIYWLGHYPSLLALADLWNQALTAHPELWLTTDELEGSIITGLLKSSLYVLKANAGKDSRVDAAAAALEAHIGRFDVAMEGLRDKPLVHALLGEYIGYGVDWLLYGDAKAKERLDYVGAAIAADFDFVTAPDGKEILIMAHGVQEYYRVRTGQTMHDFAHFTVYTGTSLANLEFGALIGLPLMTDRVMAAAARTLYWTLPTQGGPDAPVYAKDTGGGGLFPGATNRRVVQFRDGSTKPGRWLINETGRTQGVHSFQRSPCHILAYRAPDLIPKWRPELEALDRRALLGRHAVRQALLNIELGGQRLV